MLEHSFSQNFVNSIPVPDLPDLSDVSDSSLCLLDEDSAPSCPSFYCEENDEDDAGSSQAPFKSVTPRKAAALIQDPGAFGYEATVPLDARFEYEFSGGHIIGARNVRSRSQLQSVYHKFLGHNICIIVHCEYSQNRGPTLLRLFREFDRHNNEYPKLSYPHLYLLEGGYRRFYKEFPEMCVGGYIPMRDEQFVNSGDLRRSHSFFTKEILQHKRVLKPRGLQRSFSQTTDAWSSLMKESASLPSSPILGDNQSLQLSSSQGSY